MSHFKVTARAMLSTLVLLLGFQGAQAQDPLPSWNDGPTKSAILDFVAKVTKEGSPDLPQGPWAPVADF